MESTEELAKKAIVFIPEIEKNWIAESEARYDAFNRGELQDEDWDEIRKRYKC